MIALRAGLLGRSLSHSRSPELFDAWCEAQGVTGRYELVEVRSEALPETLDRLWAAGWHGFNVTIPHKRAVASLLGGQREAVNCVVRGPHGWVGHETDGAGFVDTLPVDPAGLRVTLLGAGGAARSIQAALTAAGADVRTCSVRPGAPPPDLAVDLLVNCTPLGMTGGPPADWESTLPWSDLSDDAWVADIVYAPEETPLLQAAQRRGLRTHGGMPMLRRQGELGYALWLQSARNS